MGQPVKLSDELVLDARLSGEVSQRSIASQVEFWARLGRRAEELMRGREVLALKRTGGAQSLSAALASVDGVQGRERLRRHLASQPFPHFEAAPEQPGLLVRIDEDGTRTVGRFVNRVFTPVGSK
jgi:ParD-like antitoxin of type II bacterial toxin-antitoxin system